MNTEPSRFIEVPAVISKRLAAWMVQMIVVAACSACGGGSGGAVTTTPVVRDTPAAAATVRTRVQVPDALTAVAPFNTPRFLTIPPGFGIKLWARVDGARFMARAPNGDILVSNPGAGKITLLRDTGAAVPTSFNFATGLNLPHDMVFHQIGNQIYLYLAETNRVTRSVYNLGDTQTGQRTVVVDNLPNVSLPELKGAYSHQLKNIALSADHRLYVSIASTCNACIEDTSSNPLRGAIYEFNADGSGQRLYARGVRNAEGLDFRPGSNELWVAVNSRDQMLYPFDNDFDGDGQSDYGKLLPAFVNQNPPDLFTRVRDGGNYGWPFCNSLPNPQMSALGLVRDFALNKDGTKLDCATVDRASKGIRAHSAALGMSFLTGTNVPAAYRHGAVLALHGCWNCTRLDAGYKVIYIPVTDTGTAGVEIDLITGFVIDPDQRTVWGRPVDAIVDAKGNILVSDDYAGAIYQMFPSPR
ncbi:MAG: sugar dehydrogenase [Pseudomonadota bacterium]